jgi:CheY-like chemotaxis protein/anti-sigma regulatory factor (Ser/Thr protein kinase)
VTASQSDVRPYDLPRPVEPPAILLVDDHRENLLALEAVLEPLGEPVVSVESGEEALRALLRREFAVILLDVRMASMDGLETARLIRSRPGTRHIPIIFLTAVARDANQVELAYSAGAVDYVIKPFEPGILRAKVRAFVALSRERAERVRQSRARERAEAAEQAVRTLQALSDAALAHLELEPLANELLTRACGLFRAVGGALLVTDPDQDALTVLADRGPILDCDQIGSLHATRQLLGTGSPALLAPGDAAWTELSPATDRPLAAIPLTDASTQLSSGLLLLASAPEQPVDAGELSLLGLAGDRIGVAISHARQFEHQRELVETLQRSMLPERLPEHPRVELAARYRPEDSGTRVGGDWYDAVVLDEQRIALMIGDVVGHGLAAAARMGELRNALRAYAIEGHGPGLAVQRLDRLVRMTVGQKMIATVLFGVLDLRTGSITLARAGHPPPLVRAPDGTVRLLDGGSTLPIGVATDDVPSEFTYALADGETILLYTDGVVERRSEPIDAGIERMMSALGSGSATAEASCDRVLARLLAAGPPDDDVAMLAAHVRVAKPGPLRLELPAQPDSVSLARHRLRDWLRHEAPQLEPRIASDLELALTEAASNVVRHAYGPVDATFHASATRHGSVIELVVRDTGCWRPKRPEHRGRGLPLMEAVCQELEIDSTPAGTVVTMRWSSIP